MIFGFDSQTEMWFTYPEAPDEEYCLRPITDEMLKHWNKQTTRKRWKQHQEVDERDDERYNELLADHLFANWRGGVYLSAEEMRANRTSPCNLDNKIAFCNSQGDRFLWAVNTARDMGSRLAEQITKERDDFRRPSEVSTHVPAAQL